MSDTPSSGNAKPETIRILLVEDNDGDALLLQEILSHWQYGAVHVRRADCLSAAIREVAQGGIDIILLDLGLPDSQGIDTCIRMRAAAAPVPIIVLSGFDDETLASMMIQQCAQDYIVKGVDVTSSLARTIHSAILRATPPKA